jgi:hypothetical protein
MIGAVVALLSSGCTRNSDTPSPSSTQPSQYQHIDWGMLTPPDWDSLKLLKGINLSKLQDSDPKAVELLKGVRDSWTNAPVVDELDNKKVTIRGYIAPLDGDLGHVKEFLLVPYFGACIHMPPPPSNQIVHVHLVAAVSMIGWRSAVSLSGKLEVSHSDTALGSAGYQMAADSVYQVQD